MKALRASFATLLLAVSIAPAAAQAPGKTASIPEQPGDDWIGYIVPPYPSGWS